MQPDWQHLRSIAEEEIESTLAALPAPLRSKVRRLSITFEPFPSDELQQDGIAPDTLGLFTGAEYTDEQHVPLPPQIILFLRNLWDFADDEEQVFREELRTTVLHELGHYLGLDEGELTARGLE